VSYYYRRDFLVFRAGELPLTPEADGCAPMTRDEWGMDEPGFYSSFVIRHFSPAWATNPKFD
jgi:hypothetical protein